jgi:hypothetical protein
MQSSKLGFGIALVLTGWIALASVDGQTQFGGAQPPPVKKGYLVVAGAKEYEMLTEYAELEVKFRSFDPDTSIIKFWKDYEHADKEHKDDYDRAQKTWKDQVKTLENRYNTLQNEYRQQMATARTPQDKNSRMTNFKSQMDNLNNEKRNADQAFKDAIKNFGMVRDTLEYELVVDKDAPIRKMWGPKMFDDKGKTRFMSKDEQTKYKGTDPKLPGWISKLEIFEKNTHIKIKMRPASAMTKEAEPEPEPVNSQTSSDFKTFDSPAGRFSVLMPGVPKETTQALQTPAGQIQVTAYELELSGIAYTAGFSDMPRGIITDASREQVYDGAIKGGAAIVKATIVSTNKTKLADQDGREALMKEPAGLFVRMKICFVGDRMYSLQIAGPESSVKSGDATRFFDSFKVLSAPGVSAKDDPTGKRAGVKLEDRPVVKMVIAESDPSVTTTTTPAMKSNPSLKKY